MNSCEELPYAHGGPAGNGAIRAVPEEFQVEEVLGFEPDGQGEHVMLWVEKRGENTEWLARQLARFANVPPRSVSYAGLKDRHAVTRQWFSVHLPGKADPEWPLLNSATVRILRSERHRKKLPRGALSGNRFRLGVRLAEVDEDALLTRLQLVANQGAPNYFGEQRFGRDADNVEMARRWFAGIESKPERHVAGLYLSAVRSYLFNEILARRVAADAWNQALPGDVFMFCRGHSFFTAAELTADIRERLTLGVIHPSGPLWGKGLSPASGAAMELEQAVLAQHTDLCQGLLAHGVEMGRRPYRLMPEHMRWERQDSTLWLELFLPAGGYATTVLRELVVTE